MDLTKRVVRLREYLLMCANNGRDAVHVKTMRALTIKIIESLPAGRDLDELIAQFVSGYQWMHTEKENLLVDVRDIPMQEKCFPEIQDGRGDDSLRRPDVYDYSTNISLAKGLQDHLFATQGWEFIIYQSRKRNSTETFQISAMKGVNSEFIQAETEALVIARMAILIALYYGVTLPTEN